MSHDQNDHLPRELAALLEAERAAPEPTAGARTRVLSRIEHTLGLIGGVGGGGAVGGSGGAGAGSGGVGGVTAASTTGTTATIGGGAGLGGMGGLGVLGLTTKGVIVSVLAGTVIAGGGALYAVRSGSLDRTPLAARPTAPITPRAPHAAAVPVPPPSLEPPSVAPLAPPDPPAPPSSQRVATPSRPIARPIVPVRDDTVDHLSAENALLETARTALAHGDTTAAAAALDEYTAKFADGQLAEERDALRIRLLIAKGDRPAARAAIDAFDRRYPNGMHRHTVDQLLPTAPAP